jgi:hypothetical protein
MEDAIQERCMLMFPQERKYGPSTSNFEGSIIDIIISVHGKVFGGYLMRLAYEVIPDICL